MRTSLILLLLMLLAVPAAAAELHADFSRLPERVWIGPEFWANPMEDWRLGAGRLECTSPGPNRNVHVLTRQLGKDSGTLTMSVRLGRLDPGKAVGSAGFRVGIQDQIDDYRARLIYGQGIDAGITTDGSLFVASQTAPRAVPPDLVARELELRLSARPGKEGQVVLTLSAIDPASGKEVGTVSTDQVRQSQLAGNLALVNNHPGKSPVKGEGARFWFNHWKIAGSRVEAHDDRAFGPILWSMYTLSRGVLKMTAQMPPLGAGDSQTVRLQLRQEDDWKTVGQARIDPLSCTATFRVAGWDDRRDVPYRLAYQAARPDGSKKEHFHAGTVRRDPVDQESLVVAGFTGNADYGFPNRELVRNLKLQDPDLLFFSGDQIYEYVGGYGIIRTPADRACLNYLRKWFLVGLAFGDLMRDRPTVAIPDDHDVYQGNIWGNGGNPVTLAEHERGGYVQPADMVNAVHRTQCAHLPDPFDPTPIQQGISVYYCELVYGRVSFAILADRMFKSGPRGTVATWSGRPDHLMDPKVRFARWTSRGFNFWGSGRRSSCGSGRLTGAGPTSSVFSPRPSSATWPTTTALPRPTWWPTWTPTAGRNPPATAPSTRCAAASPSTLPATSTSPPSSTTASTKRAMPASPSASPPLPTSIPAAGCPTRKGCRSGTDPPRACPTPATISTV